MTKERVLVVDDRNDIVDEFRRALIREGYDVDVALSAEEAWDLIRIRYYDVAIVDLKMGEMSGMDLLKKIDDSFPLTRVIMVTAFGDQNTPIEAIHFHAFDYMKKPVDLDDLTKAVSQAMKRHKFLIRALEQWSKNNPNNSQSSLEITYYDSEKRYFPSTKQALKSVRNKKN